MNTVYLRMMSYLIGPPVAMVPGAAYDATTGVVTIDLSVAAVSVLSMLAANVGIFAIWGKK